MKKLLILFSTLIFCITFMGCQNNQTEKTKTNDIKLAYKSLTDKEEQLLILTGNRIVMYELSDFPTNTKYRIDLIYEVYENNEKVKEDVITSMLFDEPSSKVDNRNLSLNFEKDKIRYVSGHDKTYASGSYDLEEDLSGYSSATFKDTTKLEIGTEVYIYYAALSNRISTDLPLGIPINSDVTNEILKYSNSTILIKLSFKEV